MLKNVLGRTELLKSLIVGDSVVWHYDPTITTADKQQKLFTATLTRVKGIKIKQSSALIVSPGVVPLHIIVIERTE